MENENGIVMQWENGGRDPRADSCMYVFTDKQNLLEEAEDELYAEVITEESLRVEDSADYINPYDEDKIYRLLKAAIIRQAFYMHIDLDKIIFPSWDDNPEEKAWTDGYISCIRDIGIHNDNIFKYEGAFEALYLEHKIVFENM